MVQVMTKSPTSANKKNSTSSVQRLFVGGGIAASIVLVVFGIASIVMGINGRSEIRDSLSKEAIVGSPDMTPKAISAVAKQAGVTGVDLPTCSVADQSIDTGPRAKCFASYMRIHTLVDTGGQTYAEMDRFLDDNGKSTSDEEQAATDPETGGPVENPARIIWVTETALSTALNTSYFAERVSEFSIIMGVALLLTGIGMAVLTLGALRRPDTEVATDRAPNSVPPAGTA